MSTLPPAPEAQPTRERAVAWVCSALFALQAALVSGRVHPDEVYQFLEAANRLAFGYGFKAWEWEQNTGLRNWAIPGALAGGMKLFHALGMHTAFGHRMGAALVVLVLSVPGFLGVLRYAARRVGPGAPTGPLRWPAYAALALFCLWALAPYNLGRTMGEPMGALFALAGLAELDAERPGWRGAALAGVWLGLAVVVRYAFAVLALAALLQELLRRRWHAALYCALGGGAVALALGALDWATWGQPFHSIFAYLQFNVGKGAAAKFGSEPASFFLTRTWWWLPLPLLAGLPRLQLRRSRLLLPAALYLVALTVTPHKEERFVLPVVLLVLAELAPAFVEVLRGAWGQGAIGRAGAALLLVGYLFVSGKVLAALPNLEGDLFHATMRVGADPDLTGLLITNESRWGCGGNFYLGRDTEIRYTGPGYPGFIEALRDTRVNRAILFGGVGLSESQMFGFHEAERVGRAVIVAR